MYQIGEVQARFVAVTGSSDPNLASSKTELAARADEVFRSFHAFTRAPHWLKLSGPLLQVKFAKHNGLSRKTLSRFRAIRRDS
jgi:hypothetical protein